MGRRKAYNTVALLAKRAGIPGKVGPHTFRHAVVTHALKTKPLHVVQAWVGHENPRTTERYWRDQQALDNSPAQDLADSYYGTPTDERSERERPHNRRDQGVCRQGDRGGRTPSRPG
jgi:hypothetical protein